MHILTCLLTNRVGDQLTWNDWQLHTELKCCLCKWLLYNVCQISIKQNIAHTWSRCDLLVYVAWLWCMKCYPHQSFPFPLSCCILRCDLSCSFKPIVWDIKISAVSLEGNITSLNTNCKEHVDTGNIRKLCFVECFAECLQQTLVNLWVACWTCIMWHVSRDQYNWNSVTAYFSIH